MKQTTQLGIIILLMAIILITMGWLLNTLVIKTNGGRMPVIRYPGFSSLNTSRHFSFVNSFEVNHHRLADIYLAPVNFQFRFIVFSLGDVFAISGGLIVILWGVFVMKIKYLGWREGKNENR